jgi:hypothetical protein
MQTTLNRIKLHSPCKDGWEKLLNHLNKTQSDGEVLVLRTILESNGIDDTIWAMRAVEGKDKEIRLFAADCAELVLPIYEKDYPSDSRPRLAISDSRPRLAIQAARGYANGVITMEELAAASDAASEAAYDAADAADAAYYATRAASSAAAGDSAAASWAAAYYAAGASWAASSAARAASPAERAASSAAMAASSAAMAASRDEIKQLLLKYI